MSQSAENPKWVTNAELKAEIDKLPTRWEVRFLILAAIVGSQLLPVAGVANAVLR